MPLAPSVAVYVDDEEASGVYASFSVGHSISLPKIANRVEWGIDLSAAVGYGSSDYNLAYYGVKLGTLTDAAFTAGVPIQLFENLCLTPFISYTTVLDSRLRATISGADDNLIGGISASFSF